MKIHYFLRDSSDDAWHDIELVAWLEHENVLYDDTNKHQSSFNSVETIRLHASKQANYQISSFGIDFGKDDCINSGARTLQELIKQQKEGRSSWRISKLKNVNKNEYECVRKKVFEIYHQEMFLDLDKLEENQPTNNQ